MCVHACVRACVFSSGVETVHEAIGENIAILVQWLSTFLAAIGISLYVQYQLALLLLAIVPFMGLAGFCFTKVRELVGFTGTSWRHVTAGVGMKDSVLFS